MKGLNIEVGEEKIYALEKKFSLAEAEKKVLDNRVKAFGMLSKLILRPKEDEISITYSEQRYEPFWHVLCTAHIEYSISKDYKIDVERQVITSKVGSENFSTSSGKLILPAVEQCMEEFKKEEFIDAHSNKKAKYSKYIGYTKKELRETEELMVDDVIVVPAKVKASMITRSMLSELIKPVKADEINCEKIRIDKLNLYFRPVYAFELLWKPKDKKTVVEVDGLTGELTSGRAIRQKLKEVFSETDLFELGSDAVDIFVPGGGIALRLARGVIKKKSKRS